MSHIEKMFNRLTEQSQRIRTHADTLRNGAKDQALAEQMWLNALEELTMALEELQVTGETLRAQHEQLEQTQQALDTERQRYRDLFENAPDAYLITTIHGAVIEANLAASSMFNIKPPHFVNKPLRLYLVEEDQRNFQAVLMALLEIKMPYHWDVRLQPRKRDPIHVSMTATVVYDRQGNPTSIRWVIRDVTRYKQIEDEIRALNATLEQRVAERTQLLMMEQQLKDDALRREKATRFEAEVLRDISKLFNSSLQLNDVLQHILKNVGRIVPHDGADVMLVDGDEVRIALCHGYTGCASNGLLSHVRFPLQTTFPLNIMRKNEQPLVLDDLQPPPEWLKYIDPERKSRSYAGIPIWAQGEIIGFLNLTSQLQHFFTEPDIGLLQTFSAHASAAIQNARLHEHARSLAILEERQRLARDLHDAVSQSLFTSSLVAEALPQLLDENVEEARSHIDYLYRLNRGAMAEMRSLLLELHPTHLTKTGITVLLQQLADAIKGRKEVEVALTIQDSVLPVDVKITFYRIAQEALHNIIKHAAATAIEINFLNNFHNVVLRICDNGQGFPLDQRPSGMGLLTMRERAAAINADLQIVSKPGQGTEIEVIWVAK